MKRKFIVLSNVVITFILALFGVGCESDDDGGGMYMYGPPPGHYRKVLGRVTGVDSAEIKGIRVIVKDSKKDTCDLASTDSLGRFVLESPFYGRTDTAQYIFSFKDVDGKKNGSYIDQDVEVTFLKSEFDKETYEWNKRVNVQLVAKTEEDE